MQIYVRYTPASTFYIALYCGSCLTPYKMISSIEVTKYYPIVWG